MEVILIFFQALGIVLLYFKWKSTEKKLDKTQIEVLDKDEVNIKLRINELHLRVDNLVKEVKTRLNYLEVKFNKTLFFEEFNELIKTSEIFKSDFKDKFTNRRLVDLRMIHIINKEEFENSEEKLNLISYDGEAHISFLKDEFLKIEERVSNFIKSLEGYQIQNSKWLKWNKLSSEILNATLGIDFFEEKEELFIQDQYNYYRDYLSGLEFLPKLRKLSLKNCEFGLREFEHISKSVSLNQLILLNVLTYQHYDDELDFDSTKDFEYFDRIKFFSIDYNSVNKQNHDLFFGGFRNVESLDIYNVRVKEAKEFLTIYSQRLVKLKIINFFLKVNILDDELLEKVNVGEICDALKDYRYDISLYCKSKVINASIRGLGKFTKLN